MNNNKNYIPLTDTQMAAGHEDSIFRITQTNHTLLLIVVLFIACVRIKQKLKTPSQFDTDTEQNKKKKTKKERKKEYADKDLHA